VLLSGTSTRSAPAGRRPPKPSRQVHSFMKKTSIDKYAFQKRGWEDRRTLRLHSCRRLAMVLAALGKHADAMAVLDPAFDALCVLYGREDPLTRCVVDQMVLSLGELGDRIRVTKLLLGLTDEQMALRVPAKPARKVRCRRGPVSVFAS
jgi:hypothetical protein